MNNHKLTRGSLLLCALFLATISVAQDHYRWAFKVDFDKVYDFTHSRAIIIDGFKKGFIDTTGQVVVPPQFNIIDAYAEGSASAGFLDTKDMSSTSGFIDAYGKFIITPQFEVTSPFQERIACVRLKEIWGYINPQGKFIIPPRFQGAHSFSEGLAAVRIEEKWGLIDRKGKFVVPAKYDEILGFSDGLCGVKSGGKWGYIDRTGKFIIALQYEAARSFVDGLARVRVNGKFGFISKKNKFVIRPQFENLYNFSHQLARAERNGKWGFIDQTGKFVIPAEYEYAGDFSEQLACIKQAGKWGFISTTGAVLIQPQFDQAYSFREGLARVQQNQEWGFIRYVVPAKQEVIKDIPNAKPSLVTKRNIKAGKFIPVKAKQIVIKIYDHKKVDGDIVSLNYNGVWILKNYQLTGTPYEIPLEINSKIEKNYLLLYAENLGEKPPNTLAIWIDDGVEKQKVILDSDMKTCDILYFQ